MPVILTYETHSITEDNENGIATGWLPGRLSTHGRALAADLGKRRRDTGLAAVFVSDLTRAIETAKIAFGDTGIPTYQDTRLRECDYGDLNGHPVTEVAAVRANHLESPFPGGQSYRQVIDATAEFLRELAADWDGKRVLMISHSANRWALLAGARMEDLVNAPFHWQEGWTYEIPSGWVNNHP
ncbi:hypothetical protein GCM10009765_37410 [Fodinicola feengrottensis]|uniref:Histidine phosphatase family protein n=1 Tax=Fodinicola feengrottensis TaxID=435914 RepID=A0ABP4TBC2_9ACTN